MSHSKRNTSRPVFTSHERALAKSNWSTTSARLNRDSFLPFGSCALCLGIAREPVACSQGDVFCRECALTNILAQKREIKRLEKARRDARDEAKTISAVVDEEDRERAIRDFEMTQAGLLPSNANHPVDRQAGTSTNEPLKEGTIARLKRKFTLDEKELDQIAKNDRNRARKAIEKEKNKKPTLPCFWAPSLTPEVQDNTPPLSSQKDKLVPTCPCSLDGDPHSISMQKLVAIHFKEEDGSKNETKRLICPSCLKTLSNSSNPVMAEQCGHVFCMPCIKLLAKSTLDFVTSAKTPTTCFVCDTPLAPITFWDLAGALLSPGLVTLRSEGTGFSARGSNTVIKASTAFQC
ncbi:hypothetical protein CDD83_4748 [Cordyceps sp. RAO-2017]|nr:hypothetical protein CDD83_4748 [Cordyceps sp. RAO-2017]